MHSFSLRQWNLDIAHYQLMLIRQNSKTLWKVMRPLPYVKTFVREIRFSIGTDFFSHLLHVKVLTLSTNFMLLSFLLWDVV